MPDLHYWLSGAALVFPASFLITVIIGIIPIMEGRSKKLIYFLLFAAFLITGVGWYSSAKQDEKAEQDSGKLDATQDSLKVMRNQLTDLIVKMNTGSAFLEPPELAILSPDAPAWLKAAYKEIGQREIPGPQENPRIVAYFKTIGAKENYRDDIDDWASAFVEWSLNQADIKGPKSDEPFAWLDWGQVLSQPALGAVVIMSFSGLHHVGFYFGEDENFVRVLGGNEDDAVHIFRYPKNAVYGYRWPPDLKVPDSH